MPLGLEHRRAAVRAAGEQLLEASVARLQLRAVLEVEAEGVPGVRDLERLLGDLAQRLNALREQRVDQRLLVREAPVDRADADARVTGDVVQLDAQPALGEQLAGGLEDANPVALGVLAQRFLGGGDGCHSTHSSRKWRCWLQLLLRSADQSRDQASVLRLRVRTCLHTRIPITPAAGPSSRCWASRS